MSETMPDQLTCRTPPVDDAGDPVTAGRVYVINRKRVQAFDDPDTGELLIQHVHRVGVVVKDSRPQRVDELPPSTTPVRIDV